MSDENIQIEVARRHFLKLGILAAAGTPAFLAACGSSATPKAATPTNAATTAPAATSAATAAPAATSAATAAPAATSAATAAPAGGMADLVAAAQKEGTVNLIATPPEWANYDGIIKGFVAKYNIKAPVANPEGSSADEITAITSLKGQASQPDAVDVGNTFARDNVALFTKYKVAGWDEVPANMKDPDGAWVGGYYGVIAIGANEKVTGPAPTTLKALDDPKYKNMFGLNGDPRKSSSGLNGVWAAALANGGSFDDIGPGIEFFAKLKKDGILVPVDVTPAVLASGQVSIAMDWSYNFPGVADTLAKSGITMKVNIPTDGVFGNFYAQAVVAGAPHPNAGKLWLEWLLGDEGALGYLKGGAFPARFVALQKAGKIPADLAAKLPSADVMAKVSFPTADQSKAAKDAIAKDWGPKVAGN